MALPSEFAFTTSQDGELAAQSSGIQFDEKVPIKRRSHSFILPRRKSIVNHLMDTEESLLLKVCDGPRPLCTTPPERVS